MPAFLTVREAALRTGKSPSSIRRVIYPIIQNDQHPDRKDIEPGVEDALQLRIKGESFAWRLSEELLRRSVPAEAVEHGHAGPSARTSAGQGDGALIDMLRRELDIKNQQITQHGELLAKQMELISGLSERVREGNVLIGSLQQRLALADGREAKATEAVHVKPAAQAKTEKGSPPPKSEKSAPKPAKPKRGLFSRLFRASK
jgi:hypothetical protein